LILLKKNNSGARIRDKSAQYRGARNHLTPRPRRATVLEKGAAMTVVNRKGLEEKLQQTQSVVAGSVLDSIRDFLLTAEDAELFAINPFRLAARRKLDRMATLKALLHLTKKGLFNLSWTIHCPSCKGATQQADKLQSLKHTDHCDFCHIGFDAGFDKSLEVSFGVNPAIIQPADVAVFDRLSASLETEPGIAMELDPGESHHLSMDLLPGNYLVAIAEDAKAFNVAVSAGTPGSAPQSVALDYREGLDLLTVQKALPGRTDLAITNRTARKKAMVFARMVPPRWPSAALVSSLQEFRDLFSSEMLSLNETFSIASLGFLFTDIKGSTELYERLGDADAFALVKEHFYIMERIVKAHNGGIVKTIGDAVMAAFVGPQDALATAVEMIEAFDDFETARRLKNSIIIKVGVHYGPCIAVTLNDRIDYFGTTVNIAARVQALSDGRDIMASQALFEESAAAAYLGTKKWSSESFMTSLKGLKASYQVHKLSRAG
jgi:adenylate cyclase